MMQRTKIIIDVFEQLSSLSLSLSQMFFFIEVTKFEGPPLLTGAPYSEFVKGQRKNNPVSLSGQVSMTLAQTKKYLVTKIYYQLFK